MPKPNPLPAEEPAVLFNRKRNQADQLRHSTLTRIEEDEQEFKALLAEFDVTPVIALDQSLIGRLQRSYEIDAMTILRARAEAANRSFVELWKDYQGNHTLKVKSTGRTAQLAANLLLIASPDTRLTVIFKARQWTFQFKGEEGKKLLDAWLAHCRTDIRAQFALNFGPELTKQIEFDDEGNFK